MWWNWRFCTALLEVFAHRWARFSAEKFLVALKSKFLPATVSTESSWAGGQCFTPFRSIIPPLCSIWPLCAAFPPLRVAFHPFVQHFTPLFLISAQKWPQVWDEGNPSPGILTLCMQISESLDKLSMQRESFIFIWFFFFLEVFQDLKAAMKTSQKEKGEIWIAVNNNRESWGS